MTERLHFDFSLSCIGEGNGNPLQYSCLENPRDGGAWWAAVYGVAQSRTWLKRLSSSSSQTGSNKFLEYLARENREIWKYVAKADNAMRNNQSNLTHFLISWKKYPNLIIRPLRQETEKAMAPHSSTLAWKIPWAEEPGRLQSMGSWRVGHDWATELNWTECHSSILENLKLYE